MKTLVVVTHPNLNESKANQRWVNELEKYNDEFTVHKLYDHYPDFKINTPNEQKLIESCEQLVLQFPIYWYSSPALLKQWFDDVFTYGWAYGKTGDKMKGRKVALGITLGADAIDHTPTGEVKYSVEEMLRPFEMAFNFAGANYKGAYALYGIMPEVSEDILEESIQPYLDFLRQ